MARTLDLNHLRTFVAVVDSGGFTRAAESLHLSQAAVSGHVRKLEGAVGEELFRRDTKAVLLTDAGQRLLVEANRILQVHDEAVAALGAGHVAPLVVGVTEAAAGGRLPELLRLFNALLVGQDVVFRLARVVGDCGEVVRRGIVDLALVVGEPTASNTIGVGRLPLRWVASNRFEAVQGHPLDLVVKQEPCPLRGLALHSLAFAGLAAVVRVEAETAATQAAAVEAGLGAALMPLLRVPAGWRELDAPPPVGDVGVRLVTGAAVPASIVESLRLELTAFFTRDESQSRIPILA
ncbi:MAG: LysR family transcriptional regulator [Bifidobacteriaceae bacterium]|jgi:DNA-binding transcriptional LysR family regulator|nr:LysR family transcriptional regulator [Bifidobacteriaceae bacterium]